MAAQVLRGKDITVEKAVRAVADNIGVGSPSAVTPQDMTPRVKKILETSYYEALQPAEQLCRHRAHPARPAARTGLQGG